MDRKRVRQPSPGHILELGQASGRREARKGEGQEGHDDPDGRRDGENLPTVNRC